MKFHKYHALGNDYLVLDPADGAPLPPPQQIVAICHRNFGLGSDGILYGPLPTDRADFGLQIWNPDGSEAEKSGNGLRIFSKYLFDQGKVGEQPFTIDTLGGVVTVEIHQGGNSIEVEMGKVSFHSEKIPVTGPPREVLNEEVEINGQVYRYYAATIGNPHVVLPIDSHSPKLACELGPVLEKMTARFPNRTNVQLLQIVDRNNIKIEIWERGAGYTLASGSSSSAAAAVAHKMGACDESILVHCPGGDIQINIGEDYAVTMTGPATRVGEFLMDDEVMNQVIPS
ncbi:diaminopimelate epimerase [Cerasicoccus arenae]|uniref:Diaminopimelate epimerase n=1 Tax=Cerasicoccus arenae TaxID=424488 RepID=A0A8J3DFD8_9BACT|nr:diaminopimelate epimerase [Cerasicoccus arenae]MBK1857217.1 diaminopimelate epimerase [Cerasicoccus arenae]GHC00061.1 diaminopimelate epimerase [Cerasicoccus arenae]